MKIVAISLLTIFSSLLAQGCFNITSSREEALKKEAEPEGFFAVMESANQPSFKIDDIFSKEDYLDYDKSVLNEMKKATYTLIDSSEEIESKAILNYRVYHNDYARKYYLFSDYKHVTISAHEGDLFSAISASNKYLIPEETGKSIYELAINSKVLQNNAYEKAKAKSINEYDLSTFASEAREIHVVSYFALKEENKGDVNKVDGEQKILSYIENMDLKYEGWSESPSITSGNMRFEYNSNIYRKLDEKFLSYLRLKSNYSLIEIAFVHDDELGIKRSFYKQYSCSVEQGKELVVLAIE